MTCKHCHQAIVEFTFKTGKEWWHFNPLNPRSSRGCEGYGTLAEPSE